MTWQVGDMALCTNKVECADGLEVGGVYTVSAVHCWEGALLFDDLPHPLPGTWWIADRFRKLRPDELRSAELTFLHFLERRKKLVSV